MLRTEEESLTQRVEHHGGGEFLDMANAVDDSLSDSSLVLRVDRRFKGTLVLCDNLLGNDQKFVSHLL